LSIVNVAAYYRVSSKAQDFATQRNAVERAATARGDTISMWRSEKRSGRHLARPELDSLRADARAGLIRKLYIYKLDRLTRSGISDTLQVIEELRRHGCEVVSVADGIDLHGPAAEVVLCVMAWAAKMERLAINERISAARDRVEAEGRKWGRPSRFNDEAKAKVVALHQQGRSIRDIAVALKVPKSTVGRVLRAAQ
jgi:DNA invertase Pin-like site-specific DNA recombinase